MIRSEESYSYYVLCSGFVLLIITGGFPTFASTSIDQEKTIDLYFWQRNKFLNNEVTSIATAVNPITVDEMEHRNMLDTSEIMILDSSIVISDFSLGEVFCFATVIESVRYSKNGAVLSADIVHEIQIMEDECGKYIVIGDKYKESFSNFTSCSYVEPMLETQVFSINAVNSHSKCITNIAQDEVGYQETGGYNVTKYGSWFGMQDEWCVMFIAWCANQAGISRTVIPKYATTSAMRDYYSPLGRYYSRAASSASPQVGDIYFKGSSATNTGHVGLIVKVDSEYIYTVEGNAGPNADCVYADRHSLDASYFVAFARPAYVEDHDCDNWTISNLSHSGTCALCGVISEYHNFVSEGSVQKCSTCGYSISLNKIEDEVLLK